MTRSRQCQKSASLASGCAVHSCSRHAWRAQRAVPCSAPCRLHHLFCSCRLDTRSKLHVWDVWLSAGPIKLDRALKNSAFEASLGFECTL